MNSLTHPYASVKAPVARLIIGLDGELIVVENGTRRKPRGLDLMTIIRPTCRAAGYRDEV